jgi:hypothetical protein
MHLKQSHNVLHQHPPKVRLNYWINIVITSVVLLQDNSFFINLANDQAFIYFNEDFVELSYPINGFEESIKPLVFSRSLGKWDEYDELVLLGCTNSSDIHIIGKKESTWNLLLLTPEENRALLPVSKETDNDTFPIGFDVNFSSMTPIKINDIDHPPVPRLWVLDNEGKVYSFDLFKNDSSFDYLKEKKQAESFSFEKIKFGKTEPPQVEKKQEMKAMQSQVPVAAVIPASKVPEKLVPVPAVQQSIPKETKPPKDEKPSFSFPSFSAPKVQELPIVNSAKLQEVPSFSVPKAHEPVVQKVEEILIPDNLFSRQAFHQIDLFEEELRALKQLPSLEQYENLSKRIVLDAHYDNHIKELEEWVEKGLGRAERANKSHYKLCSEFLNIAAKRQELKDILDSDKQEQSISYDWLDIQAQNEQMIMLLIDKVNECEDAIKSQVKEGTPKRDIPSTVKIYKSVERLNHHLMALDTSISQIESAFGQVSLNSPVNSYKENREYSKKTTSSPDKAVISSNLRRITEALSNRTVIKSKFVDRSPKELKPEPLKTAANTFTQSDRETFASPLGNRNVTAPIASKSLTQEFNLTKSESTKGITTVKPTFGFETKTDGGKIENTTGKETLQVGFFSFVTPQTKEIKSTVSATEKAEPLKETSTFLLGMKPVERTEANEESSKSNLFSFATAEKKESKPESKPATFSFGMPPLENVEPKEDSKSSNFSFGMKTTEKEEKEETLKSGTFTFGMKPIEIAETKDYSSKSNTFSFGTLPTEKAVSKADTSKSNAPEFGDKLQDHKKEKEQGNTVKAQSAPLQVQTTLEHKTEESVGFSFGFNPASSGTLFSFGASTKAESKPSFSMPTVTNDEEDSEKNDADFKDDKSLAVKESADKDEGHEPESLHSVKSEPVMGNAKSDIEEPLSGPVAGSVGISFTNTKPDSFSNTSASTGAISAARGLTSSIISNVKDSQGTSTGSSFGVKEETISDVPKEIEEVVKQEHEKDNAFDLDDIKNDLDLESNSAMDANNSGEDDMDQDAQASSVLNNTNNTTDVSSIATSSIGQVPNATPVDRSATGSFGFGSSTVASASVGSGFSTNSGSFGGVANNNSFIHSTTFTSNSTPSIVHSSNNVGNTTNGFFAKSTLSNLTIPVDPPVQAGFGFAGSGSNVGFGGANEQTGFSTPQSGFSSTKTAPSLFGSTNTAFGPGTSSDNASGISSLQGSQPAFGQSTFGQPAFGQPAFGQPAFGQPAFGQSTFESSPSVFGTGFSSGPVTETTPAFGQSTTPSRMAAPDPTAAANSGFAQFATNATASFGNATKNSTTYTPSKPR